MKKCDKCNNVAIWIEGHWVNNDVRDPFDTRYVGGRLMLKHKTGCPNKKSNKKNYQHLTA